MADVRIARTDDLDQRELGEIRALMDHAFDGEFSDDDWDHTIGGWHVLVTDGGELVAHGSVVERMLTVGGRELRAGYVEGVATVAHRRGEGLGSTVMRSIREVLHDEGFDLGALSTGAHALYEPLGWERWQGPTYVQGPQGLERTEEEDDGIMVLRLGATAGMDLTQPIACEARSGDDW